MVRESGAGELLVMPHFFSKEQLLQSKSKEPIAGTSRCWCLDFGLPKHDPNFALCKMAVGVEVWTLGKKKFGPDGTLVWHTQSSQNVRSKHFLICVSIL